MPGQKNLETEQVLSGAIGAYYERTYRQTDKSCGDELYKEKGKLTRVSSSQNWWDGRREKILEMYFVFLMKYT